MFERKALAVSLAAAAMTVALPAAAHAALPTSAIVKDAKGDTQSSSTGEAVESDTDLYSIKGAKSGDRVLFRLQAKDINNSNATPAKAFYTVDVQIAGVVAHSVRNDTDGRVLLRAGATWVACKDGKWVADKTKDQIRFSLPSKCIGTPKSLRVRGGSYLLSEGVVDDTPLSAKFRLK